MWESMRASSFLWLTVAVLQAEVPAGKVPSLERVAVAGVVKARIPALSVAVAAGDGSAWTAAWGFADLENFVPATPKTVFRLGSISKPFTAVAAMKLWESGRLDLDAEVQRYLPVFPRKTWAVTERLLLCHQAGIRHYNYNANEFDSTRHYDDVAAALSIFGMDPLEFEPGTRTLYSTYGFNLAGAVVQSVAGQPYSEFVRQAILEPSGAATMRRDDVYAVVPYRARGYRRRQDEQLENCALADTSNKVPGGGWISTAEDLVRFARALMDGKLLKSETLETMWTPQKLKDGSVTGIALGWNVSRTSGTRVLWHSGGQQGTSTHLLLVPDKRLAVAVMANLEGAPAQDIAWAMLEELLK
jgi:serine beta-lactamase-like protein LACTB, mitochondrial